MKKWIAFLLIIAMMSSFVCYADAIDFEDLEVIVEDDGQIHEDELNIEMDESEALDDDALILDGDVLGDFDLIGLELDDIAIPKEEATDSCLVGTNSAPSEAQFWNGHYYHLYDRDDILTWEDAENFCESMGGYLATITSAEEDLFIYNNIVLGAGYSSAYFGLSDAIEEGSWKWVTGEKTEYVNWETGEPNGSRSENYAMYYYQNPDGRWNDGDFRTDTVNNGGNAFICEWGDASIEQPKRVTWNGHDYQLYDIDSITSWKAAKDYCESLGGYLATITSAEEDDFIYRNVVRASGYSSAYFGFSDDEKEDNWKWVTGEKTEYVNWESGEPNGGRSENYAMYYFQNPDGRWNDGDFRTDTVNNGGKAFICEWGDYSIEPELAEPIVIETRDGTKAEFNNSLERYITNMDSDKYYPDLAYMLVALSGAAYNTQGEKGGLLTRENAGHQSESKELKHITKAYEDLGFNDYQVFNYYNNPDDPAYGADNVAFTIGRKQLSDDDALVLIVVRGSYGDLPDLKKKDLVLKSDWQSDFRINTDSKGHHQGFARAADKVYKALKSFMKNRQFSDATMKSNVRYVITGHSRGGGVANLLAVKLHDVGVPNSNVYDYNFACPDTVKGFVLADLKKNHENIFNICNSADFISVVPGIIGDVGSAFENLIKDKYKNLFLNWGKYGTTRFYCKDWNDPKEFDLIRTFDVDNSPHDTKFYIPDIGKNTYGFYSWSEITLRKIELKVVNSIDKYIKKLYPKYVTTSEDIAKAKVTVSDQVYTGKTLKPSVKVVLNKKTLKKGTDYTVSYKNNKSVGTATVIITGKNNYRGTKKVTFRINPQPVKGLKLGSGKGQITASWGKGNGITGYELQYSLKKSFDSAKKVTIAKAATVKKKIGGLKSGNTYFVRIRAYKKVVGKTYYSAWSTAEKVKVS